MLLTKEDEQRNRWAEHFSKVLTDREGPTRPPEFSKWEQLEIDPSP